MKAWNDIINKASLGSSKLPLTVNDLPADISNALDVPDTTDPEENFLLYSSLVYQFRQGGTKPRDLNTITNPKASDEEKPYCSQSANIALKEALSEDLPQFVELWLERCSGKNQLAHPEMLPTLFDIALKKKQLRKLITSVAGKRGEWLAQLNPQWSFSAAQDVKMMWETGSLDDRKNALATLRVQNPAEALNLLQSTWTTEGASEKLAFLEILDINLSGNDLTWLEGLTEKGQKVTNAILGLLKAIKGSSIINEYESILKKMVNIKTSKTMLGMLSKTTIEVTENVEIPPSIFKTGIEKMSSDKNVSDGLNIALQLLAIVPPSSINDHFKLQTSEIIEILKKEKRENFVASIMSSTILHRDAAWARALLDQTDITADPGTTWSLLLLVPEKDRDRYAMRFFTAMPGLITEGMRLDNSEWSIDLAKTILKLTANDYAYNKSFYRPASVKIPVSLIDSLESFSSSDEQKKAYWKNQSDELVRLLILKRQILQSFNL